MKALAAIFALAAATWAAFDGSWFAAGLAVIAAAFALATPARKEK